MIRQSKELQTGKAGEYLVCADLILKGFIAFPSEQGLPYDILLDTGKKLLKVQVKTTEKPRVIPQRKKESKAYIFNIKRKGKNNQNRYLDDEIDLFALVELESNSIIYLKTDEMPDTINLRVDYLKGTYYDEKGIKDYNDCLKLHEVVSNKSEIARRLNLDISTVHRYLTKGFKPYESNARYWSDFKREKEWFYEI